MVYRLAGGTEAVIISDVGIRVRHVVIVFCRNRIGIHGKLGFGIGHQDCRAVHFPIRHPGHPAANRIHLPDGNICKNDALARTFRLYANRQVPVAHLIGDTDLGTR